MTNPYQRITPLGSVAKVISGFAFRSGEFSETGILVIKIKNIQLGEIDLTDTQCVSDHYLSIPIKYHVDCGDILISLTGSHINQPNSVVGRVARYNRRLPKALLNQRAGKVLVMEPDKCDPGFLYYHLYEEKIRREIAAFAHGAANQANVSPGQIESLCISLPPLPTQQKIAAILSAYDDLIENNLRRITILETMAQNLYRAAEGFARIGLLDDAVEALVASEEIKRRYLDLANTVQRLYKAVLPDPTALEFAVEVTPVQVIADKIRALTPPADISLVMQQVEGLLDRSIATEGYIIRETTAPYGDEHWIDLSKIDFEKLAEKFKTGRKRTMNEKLEGTVAAEAHGHGAAQPHAHGLSGAIPGNDRRLQCGQPQRRGVLPATGDLCPEPE